MSAFIVDNKTVNKIVSWIEKNKNTPDHTYTIGEFYKVFDTDNPNTLGKELLKLNIKSVAERYNNGDVTVYNDLLNGYSYKYIYYEGIPEVVKALHCFHYQCDEGLTCSTDQFKAIADLINHLQYIFIADSPAYKLADWN